MVSEARRQECFGLVKKQENAKKARKNAKALAIFISIAASAFVAFVVVLITVIMPNVKYNNYMENGQYNEIIKIVLSQKGVKERKGGLHNETF
jgi:hypothetical protein